MKIITTIMTLYFTVLMNVFSQVIEESSLADTLYLDEVFVTGTTVKVNRKNIPLSVSQVNKRQITESNETSLLPVLNGRVPGLFVTERGVMGFGVAGNAAGHISMRGIGGSPTTGVLMLIDGHPQYMGIFGHPLPDTYVASDVDRVEVIRGPGSILYGSNAMGGVINIITKKQIREGLSANAHLMYGSFNTSKFMLSGGYRKNRLSVFASINRDHTDGQRPNSEFGITNGYLKMSYKLSEELSFNTDLSLAGFSSSDPGPDTLNALRGYTQDITRGYWSANLDNDFGKYSGSAKFFYNFGEHNISDGFHSNDINYGLNIYESVKLFRGNTITFGTDILNFGGRAENLLAMGGQGMLFSDTTVTDAGFYGFVQQEIFSRLTLNAGLRYQVHSVYGDEWIPSGGVAYRVTDNTTLKTTVSKGFRSPTISELFMWNHNTGLAPETIMNYEAGITQSLLNRKIKLELSVYLIEGTNMIVSVPLEGLKNSGEVFNRGIEFAATVNPGKNLMMNFTYSFIDMKIPVYATPRHHLFLSGNYSMNRLLLTLSTEYVDHLDTDSSDKTHFEFYTLINAKASYKILKYAEIFISGENLLDQKYENNRYYSMPGITFFGGLKVSL